VQVGSLREIVRDARARTGVPGVAAGVLRDGAVETCADGVLQIGGDAAVRPETPFRIASISKPFTASLALSSLPLGAELVGWLSHTAGFVCEAETPLPEGAEGLFSYSNAGYWAAGREVARVSGTPFEEAMRARILEPLGLEATGYDDPGAAAARGHLQDGETGHRAVPEDVYPVVRRPSGGLWSTVGDLLRFAAHHLGGPGPLADQTRAAMREPQSQALGAGYGLGWWVHDAGGRAAFDHEGSVAGYQSLLLLVPEERLALAVLTNSWRGSGLVRRVVEQLGLAPAESIGSAGVRPQDVAGRYALGDAEAVVEAARGGLLVEEADVDPVTGSRIAAPRYPATELRAGVFGVAGGMLMSHRLDFPRPGFARIGWVVLPRSET
jgi:CubicO group peptidase (beta-lactamase class C family)